MAEREKAEDVFTILIDEKHYFSDTSQQAIKKCENWRNHFQDTENITQNKKINVKHVQQKKETDKIVFLVRKEKQKKKV